jgi:8-oxo-dGTP diphosphatase
MEYKEKVAQLIREMKTHYLPSVSMDFVIFGFHEGQLNVLLLQWKGLTNWLLPGGRVGNNENLDAAAHRSLQERTGLNDVYLQQFYTFGNVIRSTHYAIEEMMSQLGLTQADVQGLGRDVSVGYYALVEHTRIKPVPDLLTEEIRWWNINELPRLLFDHNDMIDVALKTLRRQLSYQPIGYNLMPDTFTMPELQQLYETILGQSLDRRNFQKRMLSYGILERLEERKFIGAHKAPYLYRFNIDRYKKAMDEEQVFSIR